MDSAVRTPALLPPLTRVFGPVTGRRVLRLLGLYLLMAAAGSALALLSHDGHWQALGLGLVLPGGGFLAHYDLITAAGIWHLVAAVSAAGLFALALGVWFGTGNIVAPPAVWLGAAFWAATMPHGEARNYAITTVFAVADLILLVIAVVTIARYLFAIRQRKADNAFLATSHAVFPVRDSDDEMSLDHLKRLRFALDRALQPVEAFDGFEHLDPFQTAAIRYQINFLAYGLALSHARFTPAFAGYGLEAQRLMIGKLAEPSVWSYWKLENLWGNFSADANPLGRDNIMYTGFLGLQMALLKASTGADDFDAGKRFRLGSDLAFDAGDIEARLVAEYDRSPFCLYPCEPNWIYPLCNTIGAAALLPGGGWPVMEDRFRHGLDEEFLDHFGRFVPCRSSRTGLALPAIGGAMPLAMPCFFLSALAPDIALRQWLLLRRRLFTRDGRFNRAAFWQIDTGNYTLSRASAYTAAMLAAAELGDNEVYDACLAALEDECPAVEDRGVIHRRHASVWAHGVELMARGGTRDGFRDLLKKPHDHSGPRLEDVDYADVLVASAHVEDGVLRAVLYGVKDDATIEIAVAGLAPRVRYALHGGASGHIVADDAGVARFTIHLKGRTLLRLHPE